MDEPVDDALHTELAFLRKRVALLERAESARTGVEGMFRAVIDTLPQSIFWKDRHSIYIGCNQQFAHDVGAQSPIDIMGKDDTAMRWAAYAAEYRADDVTIMTTQVPRLNFEERVQRTDGTQGWVRTSKLPIFNATGDVIGVLGVSEDITERRALEMRVQQTQKLEVLGRLAGSIAHDFNNVLMVIRGCAALAAIQLPDLHPARTEVRAIEQASDHATSLIHQLLTFARQQVFTPQRLALPEVIRRMEGLLQRLLGATIQIAIDLSPDVWAVYGDASQLEQVLINMATNAGDAMPHGGQFTIRGINRLLSADHPLAVAPGAYVALTISDTGMGMTETVQQHLFEPFFTTKTPDQGTGLGLATCYGIVTQLGGTITVSSTLERGTTFTILLPSTSASLESVLQHARGG